MDDQHRIWLLLSRKVSGEASGSELAELEQLLRDNPGNQAGIEAFHRMWDCTPPAPEKEKSIAGLLSRINAQPAKPETHNPSSSEPDTRSRAAISVTPRNK